MFSDLCVHGSILKLDIRIIFFIIVFTSMMASRHGKRTGQGTYSENHNDAIEKWCHMLNTGFYVFSWWGYIEFPTQSQTLSCFHALNVRDSMSIWQFFFFFMGNIYFTLQTHFKNIYRQFVWNSVLLFVAFINIIVKSVAVFNIKSVMIFCGCTFQIRFFFLKIFVLLFLPVLPINKLRKYQFTVFKAKIKLQQNQITHIKIYMYMYMEIYVDTLSSVIHDITLPK